MVRKGMKERNLENHDGMFEIESSIPTVISTKYQQQTSEPIVQMCSVKKVFSKISQNSQENTCPRGSILKKLQVLNNEKPKQWQYTKKVGPGTQDSPLGALQTGTRTRNS